MSRVDNWRFRWHLARTIQRRDLRATIYGFGLYVTTSAAIATAATVLRNHVKSVQDSGLVVLSNPFATPFFGAMVISSVYLAVASTTTIARERDQGTLETLFYGPVDAVAYLLGKYLAQMSTYALMVAGYLVAFALYAPVTNFALDLDLLWAALLSAATASAVVAVGILLSTLNHSARSAILTLLAVVLASLGLQLGHEYVSSLASGLAKGGYHPLLSLQAAFTWLNRIVNWLSPFTHLERGIDALMRGSTGEYLLMMGLSLSYAAIVFGLALRALRRKGVSNAFDGGGCHLKLTKASWPPKRTIEWLLALALLLLAVTLSQAGEPDKTETLVYSGQVFNGLGYASAFYPPAVKTIYLLAGQQNILSPRRTMVYFWPLTNTYKADWTSMNQTVAGSLEILDDDKVIATVPQESYVTDTLVGQGCVVDLPAGRYAVRVRADDGSIVPGSRKKLVVFAPRRQGLGYQIVPQEEWTRPERTDDPADVIYARQGMVLYLQPYVKEEYNDLYYTRLVDLQSHSGRKDRWTWVYVRPFEEIGNLILDFDTQTVEVLAKPYRVEQLPGSALEYKVVDYDPVTETHPPDFVAYQLFVDANHASYHLRLQNTDARVVVSSQRQVRRVREINSWALYFPAGLPLTAGGFLIVSRYERLAAGRKTLPPGEQ